MGRFATLEEIRRLDPVTDHERIVFLSTCFDFPFDTTRALEFALFRTFAVPSVSGLLDRTGEFARRAQKRYDDTDILVSELMEHGYSSGRGRAAVRRINQLHGRFDIANDDFLYVLSTFIYEPIRWNGRYGWRQMCDQERLAMFHFWCAVGRLMDIRQIPDDYDAFEQFNVGYERNHLRFDETNHRVGGATREMFVSWAPWAARPLARHAIHALMDDDLLEAFGFPKSSAWFRAAVRGTLRMRGGLVRWLPPRTRPRLRTAMYRTGYPRGYRIEELGPPV